MRRPVHAEAGERRKPKRPQAPAQAANPVHSKLDCDRAQGDW
jgi:hypothetical protein